MMLFIILCHFYTIYAHYIAPAKCNEGWLQDCKNNIGNRKDRQSCQYPRAYYESFDQTNPCCPKYNCICEGLNEGGNKNERDLLIQVYKNCTIIQKNLIIEGSPINLSLNDILEDIEEVWGYVEISDNYKIDGIVMEKLRIIRGEAFTTVTKNGISRNIALKIQNNTVLKKLVFPKLTEISKGDVQIWLNNNLCHIMTIDWYGEIFTNPCNPDSQIFNVTDANDCQYTTYNYNCLSGKYGDFFNKEHHIYLDRKQIHKYIYHEFIPKYSGKLCKDQCLVKYHSTQFVNKKTIASIIGKESSKDIYRCWDRNVCQQMTRSNCSTDTIYLDINEITNVAMVSRCAIKPATFNAVGCHRYCSGGCEFLPSPDYLIDPTSYNSKENIRGADVAKLLKTISNNPSMVPSIKYSLVCNSCKSFESQLPGREKCLAGKNEECLKSFSRDLPSAKSKHKYCFEHDEGYLKKKNLKVIKEGSESGCPDKTLYDPEKKDCVVYCTGQQFETDHFDNFEYRKNELQTCKACQRVPTKNPDGEPLNGFECSYEGLDGTIRSERICYGPGNPKWKKHLEDHATWCKNQDSRSLPETCLPEGAEIDFLGESNYDNIQNKTVRHLKDCTVLDGNFILEVSAVDTSYTKDTYDKLIQKSVLCRSIRSLRVITGYMIIHSWIGKSLDCFERLEDIFGKETNKSKGKDYAVDIHTGDKDDSNVFNLTYFELISLKRIRYGYVTINAGQNDAFCQVQVYNKTNDKLENNPIWDTLLLNGQFIGRVATDPKNDQCHRCHPECDAKYGCVGGSAHYCIKCLNFNDTSALDGIYNSSRTDAVWGNYIVNATTFDDSERNENQWQCTDKCPVLTYEDGNNCKPCHTECGNGCSGPSAADCTDCRNSYVIYDNDTIECVANCEDIDETHHNYNMNWTVRPYYTLKDASNLGQCKRCHRNCLSGCSTNVYESIDECIPNYTNGNNKEVCYNATVDGDQSAEKRVFTYDGRGCENIFKQCSCGFKYRCILTWTSTGEISSECASKPTDLVTVLSTLLMLSAVIVILIAVIVIFWKKEASKRKHQHDLAMREVKKNYYGQTDNTPEKLGENEVNRLHFFQVRIIDYDDITFEGLLGKGHFAEVYKGTFTLRGQSLSTSDSEKKSGSENHSLLDDSKRSKTKFKTKFKVAIKQLKLEDQLERMSIKQIIELANLEDYKAGSEIDSYFHELTKPSELRLRYKRMYYQAKESELINEATNVAPLQHHHLIRLLGLTKMREQVDIYGVTQITPALMIIDYADKGELRTWIKNHIQRIDERHPSRWLCQIAKAMKYLEENQIVHRDLAVRNILLMSEFHIAVSDFGLAKIIKRNQPTAESYRLEILQFPAYWYAPEVLERRIYTHKSDVWSFGITAWEILTLCQYDKPYDSDEEYEKFVRECFNGKQSMKSLKHYLNTGRTVSFPKYNDLPTCSSEFWFKHMLRYFNKDQELRPSFKSIEHTFEEEIEKNMGEYFMINRNLNSTDSSQKKSKQSDLLCPDNDPPLSSRFFQPYEVDEYYYNTLDHQVEAPCEGDNDVFDNPLVPPQYPKKKPNLSNDGTSSTANPNYNPTYQFDSLKSMSPPKLPTTNSLNSKYINDEVNRITPPRFNCFNFVPSGSPTVTASNPSYTSSSRYNQNGGSPPAAPLYQRGRSIPKSTSSPRAHWVNPPKVPTPQPRRRVSASPITQSSPITYEDIRPRYRHNYLSTAEFNTDPSDNTDYLEPS